MLSQKTLRQKQLRAERVAAGFCSNCTNKRNLYKSFCDKCAEDHRQRQRKKYVPKPRPVEKVQPDESIVLTTTKIADAKRAPKPEPPIEFNPEHLWLGRVFKEFGPRRWDELVDYFPWEIDRLSPALQHVWFELDSGRWRLTWRGEAKFAEEGR